MNHNLDNETQGEFAGDVDSRTLAAPPLETREHSVTLAVAHKVIRRFNRDTTCVAMGLLGTVIFAALALVFQECHSEAADLTKEARQTGGNLVQNANPAALSDVVGSNGKSRGEITSGRPKSVDYGFTPEINHPDVQSNASSWSSTHRQDTARVRPTIHNITHLTSVRPRLVDVKTRLIALWHQSLTRNETSRGWILFSDSKKGGKKKVSYTAEANH